MSCDLNDRSLIVRFFDSFLQERNIKWMLGLGTLILFGSSVKLISTHWNETSAAWKHVILLAYTAAIAVTANQCFWRLGLRTTGTVLMALTVLLLPVTFLAWHWVWTEATHDAWSVPLNLALLGVNLVAGWIMASSIFRHLLRGRQPTFEFCYLALAAAGAFVSQWHDVWPVAALVLWGLMTMGTVKVHRHMFWLTEELRLPRIFGFFPIALLGTQFLLLFAFYLAPGIPLQWLGLACVLFAVPVLSTADAAAAIYQQRTGNLIRPIPLAIILPMFVGLTLCVVGICLSGIEFAKPTALVPTAAIAAALMANTAKRTNKPAFVWALLVCAVLSYNFSYVFFMDLAKLVVQQGAHAVHEPRLPYAFYGLTYLPFLIVLTAIAAWTGRRGSELFAQPLRRFAVGLSCFLLAAAFQHEKAVFPVSAAMVGMFALQIGMFRNGRLLFLAIAAFVGASFSLSTFATGVCGLSVLPDMQLVCLATAAVALFYPGMRIDRFVGNMSTARRRGTRESSGADLIAARSSHEFRDAAVNHLCQRVSLGMTLLLAVTWCQRAFLSSTPLDLCVSEGVLLLLLVLHALVWQSTRMAEFTLVFAGFGSIVHAVHAGFAADEIISGATACLIVLWLSSYVLSKTTTGRLGLVFGPATRNLSDFCLTLLMAFSFLPQFAWGTLNGANQITWPSSIVIVVWAFDAARRFASPIRTLLGCLGTVGLATAGLTGLLGLEDSREWLLAAWGAAAFAGAFPAVWLSRQCDLHQMSSGDSPDDERHRAVYSALGAPLRVVVLGSLIVVAAVSTVFFSLPARAAGAIAVAGFLCLAFNRRRPQLWIVALAALNWQLLSGLVQACVPGIPTAFPNAELWLVSSSRPLALLAAASALLVIYLSSRSVVCPLPLGTLTRSASEDVRSLPRSSFGLVSDVFSLATDGLSVSTLDLIDVHRLLMHGMTAGALLASLVLWPQGLAPLQISMVATTFAIVIAGILWQACRLQDVRRVWLAEGLTGVAFAYFVLFGVIELGSGVAPFVLLGTGLALYAAGQIAANRSPVAVLSRPFLLTGMLLPMTGVVLATGRHLLGSSTTMLGMNSLVLLAAAAFYFWQGLEQRQRKLVVLSAIILNSALVLLWRDLSWTDPQLFLIPLGLSVLGLVELLQAEIPREMHNPLRYAGALVILVSPTFHIISGSWVHLFTLMAASVFVTLLSIGLRVRALMYTGVAFLVADILAMVVRGSIDRPNLLWIAGIGLGTAVLVLGALCENRREVLMQRLRILTTELESWR